MPFVSGNAFGVRPLRENKRPAFFKNVGRFLFTLYSPRQMQTEQGSCALVDQMIGDHTLNNFLG